jgi:hypothetical protein
MNLDYEDYESGGMTLHNPAAGRRPMVPYWAYKHSEEFKAKQAPKPMYASRDTTKSELRFWEVEDGRGHVHEVAGQKMYLGRCGDCDDVVLKTVDVSGPEFRGHSRGWRGKWPRYCEGCRDRRCQESVDRRRGAKRQNDRERIAAKRFAEREESTRPQRTEGYWYRDDNGEEQWMPPTKTT